MIVAGVNTIENAVRLLNATCYMIDTRILTINEEMAEIIEAKVGTSNIEII